MTQDALSLISNEDILELVCDVEERLANKDGWSNYQLLVVGNTITEAFRAKRKRAVREVTT